MLHILVEHPTASLVLCSWSLLTFIVFGVFLGRLWCKRCYDAKKLIGIYQRGLKKLSIKQLEEHKKDHKEEYLTLYQTSVDHLISFKSTQWNLLYYCMISFAALFGISRIVINFSDQIACFWFGGISIVIAEIGLHMILRLQLDIRYTRIIMNHSAILSIDISSLAFQHLSVTKLRTEYKTFRDWTYPVLFIITVIIGFGILNVLL